jgi:ribosomal protein S4E
MTNPDLDAVKEGTHCTVVSGTHKGKAGVVRDVNTSKGGNITITVVQADGERFKTLARSVVVHDAATAIRGPK